MAHSSLTLPSAGNQFLSCVVDAMLQDATPSLMDAHKTATEARARKQKAQQTPAFDFNQLLQKGRLLNRQVRFVFVGWAEQCCRSMLCEVCRAAAAVLCHIKGCRCGRQIKISLSPWEISDGKVTR
jgi:hypothetical protein